MGSRRFEITETAGSVKGFYVVVDRETGVNYLVAKFGTGGGYLCLLYTSKADHCLYLLHI